MSADHHKGDKDILAEQTLRNWTMAATFLARAAILIGLGIFNLAVTADNQGELSQLIAPLSSAHPGLWLVKRIVLGADFLFAFFDFTLTVRYYNHTGFMINLPVDSRLEITVEDDVKILDRVGTHYTLGMRGYYLSLANGAAHLCSSTNSRTRQLAERLSKCHCP